MASRTVVIVGVGALGSHVVQFLRNEDVRLRVIDFDRVEGQNIPSQFYGKTNVGKTKVIALKQQMNFLWGRQIETISHKLIRDNVDVLLGDADLVIDCLDNGESRRVVQDFVRGVVDDGGRVVGSPEHGYTTERPVITQAGPRPALLHGALAADGSYGQALWDEDFNIDDEAGAGAATCEDDEALPFIVVVAGYLARSAQTFLANGEKLGWVVSPAGAVRI